MGCNMTGEVFESLDRFTAQIEILEGDRADALRQGFARAFVAVEHPEYKSVIEGLQSFSDGKYYVGYLWDYLRNPTIVTGDQIWERLLTDPTINVMWGALFRADPGSRLLEVSQAIDSADLSTHGATWAFVSSRGSLSIR
jgi:hypothetical protein